MQGVVPWLVSPQRDFGLSDNADSLGLAIDVCLQKENDKRGCAAVFIFLFSLYATDDCHDLGLLPSASTLMACC